MHGLRLANLADHSGRGLGRGTRPRERALGRTVVGTGVLVLVDLVVLVVDEAQVDRCFAEDRHAPPSKTDSIFANPQAAAADGGLPPRSRLGMGAGAEDRCAD